MRRFSFSLTWLAICSVLLPIGCAASGRQAPQLQQPATGKHPALRVGAWNIEWLGSPQRRSGPARDQPRTPEALAEYILAADVDILGLEEIRIDAPDGSDRNALISAALRLVEQQRGGRWEHRLFPARGRREQCCGVAWDTTRVRPVGQPRIITAPQQQSVQGRTLWSRPPRGWLFTAGEGLTDFVLIVIHMKSNYGGDFARHRAQEAETLLAELPLAFSDPDVLIIGDANCSSHAEPAVVALTAGGFVDLNADDRQTHWRYGPLDRAFVPAEQPEFARRYFEVLSDSFLGARKLTVRDFKVRYSDHFLIVTEIDVGADDD